jgi:hypothetical protein
MIESKTTRAISIRQPYVEMILRGIKKAEYRSQLTHIRERVYLYASLKPGDEKYYDQLGVEPGTLPTGLIVGTVEIVDCKYRLLRSDYQWILANPQRLKTPLKPERQPQPVFFKPFND